MLQCDKCKLFKNSNPHKYTKNQTIEKEFCSIECIQKYFINNKKIIDQIIEFIEYNKDQQEMVIAPYYMGYFRGKISGLQDILSLIRN